MSKCTKLTKNEKLYISLQNGKILETKMSFLTFKVPYFTYAHCE